MSSEKTFEKLLRANSDLPIIITEHDGIYTIRDDVIFGGSKMRVIIPLMEQYIAKGIKDFVYFGPSMGFAIVAIAIAAHALGVRSTLFVRTYQTFNKKTKKIYGKNPPQIGFLHKLNSCTIHEIRYDQEFNDDKIKNEWVSKYINGNPHERLFLEIGKMTETFPLMIEEKLRNADAYIVREEYKSKYDDIIQKIRMNPNLETIQTYADSLGKFQDIRPRKIFVVATGATMYYVLSKIFNSTEFIAVQVSSAIWAKKPMDMSRTTECSYKFFDKYKNIWKPKFNKDALSKDIPPWDAVPSYDAKVNRFIHEHDKYCGTYVYNIAGNKSINDLKHLYNTKFIAHTTNK